MDRRDFIRGIAVLCAGAAALPEQIDFFEKYYTANAPAGELTAAVDELLLSGTATKSMPVHFRLYRPGSDELSRALINVGCNLFGGMMRWAAMPDQKIIVGKAGLRWRLQVPDDFTFDHFLGQISYVDTDLVRHYRQITTLEGTV
jgi:hypothetical protein